MGKELNELRQSIETQLPIHIVEDDDESTAIHMIKVHEEQLFHSSFVSQERLARDDIALREPPVPTHERFREFAGRVTLSEDGLLATCYGNYWDGSNVYGTRFYASGKHAIHFRIEYKGSNNLFFGIRTTAQDMPVQTLTSPYTYGWWELDQVIESVSGHRVHNDRGIRTGDEITMTLDCDNRQIGFEHHRMNMITYLPVELGKCPFPWKLLVTLRATNDSIRIIV